MAKPQRTQNDQRRFINPVDQFNRLWFMSIEILTGEPTGAILPCVGKWPFLDPLKTPGAYVKIPVVNGQSVLGRCEVDFPRWVDVTERDEEQWYRQLVENAIQKNVDITDMDKLEKNKILVGLTGKKPWPPAAVLKRAQGGYKPFLGLAPLSPADRQALGTNTIEDFRTGAIKSTVSETAASEIPDTYKEFVSWAFQTNQVKSLGEAGALWRQHREALAEA